MMHDFFSTYDGATVWYHPLADRLFIFYRATFLMLPCLEREDGRKCIIDHPSNPGLYVDSKGAQLEYIGEL